MGKEPNCDCDPGEVECVPQDCVPSGYTVFINDVFIGTVDSQPILTPVPNRREHSAGGYTVRGHVDPEFRRLVREQYHRTHRRPIKHV